MSILDLIRPELKTINNYQLLGDRLTTRLHANESPWQPVEIPGINLNHYPDVRRQQELKESLAADYQVNPEQLLVTRGSDDGIDLLMRLFLTPGQDSILQCPPTFSMYAFYAQIQNAKVFNCPLEEIKGFNLSLDKLVAAWNSSCKIIMLCRPNNPTGNLLDLESVSRICNAFTGKAIVVIDEAYIEFSEACSASSLISRFENLLVLRTLSKAYGLAGLRLGCVIAQAPIITALQNIMAPYLIPSPILEIALRALQDKNWFTSTIKKIINSRELLINALQQSSLIDKIYPSRSNFVLIKSPHAQGIASWFAEHDVAVRHFASHPQLNAMLRITVGSEAQITQLTTLLGKYIA
jgi:histidinol-phosphate aminotransferase